MPATPPLGPPVFILIQQVANILIFEKEDYFIFVEITRHMLIHFFSFTFGHAC